MKKGLVTIPTDSKFVEGTKKYIEYWGADAVRDCDGTSLPINVKDFNVDVYKTYFIARGDNKYAKEHKEFLQHFALSSKRYTALNGDLIIPLLENIIEGQCEIDLTKHKEYWQVFDRTSGKLHNDWEYVEKNKILVKNPVKFHEYSVNYFAFNTWDPVQIYNYVTNNWTVEKDLDIDPVYDEARAHMLENMEKWLIENKDVTVVRFTTFFYNFFFLWIDGKKQQLFDWHNYASTASIKMFELYEKTYNETMTLEDVLTEGYYANRFIVPNEKTRKYIDLVQRKSCEWAKEFVDLCHKYGKKAMMFDGDNRIGTEPYNPYFSSIGLDAVVGAPHSGIYIRQLSDMSGINFVEARFNPYFFPDTIPNDKEATNTMSLIWNSSRRAMLAKPVDRIGFGGYLSLADKYPGFVKKIKEVCDEFRFIKENAGDNGAKTFVKVAIISYWGRQNTWMINGIGIDDIRQDSEAYSGLLTSLCGQPVDVSFISFDDVINDDLSKYDILISNGLAETSFGGGKCFENPLLVEKIKTFVYEGGGYVGIGDASGHLYQGKFFQLEDVLGVQKEVGLTYMFYHDSKIDIEKHFITDDLSSLSQINYGEGSARSVYSIGAKVIDLTYDNHFPKGGQNGHVRLAVNEFGKGRSVYLSGLAESYENRRLLYRALLWCAKKEGELFKAFSSDMRTDCYYYPIPNVYAILNNSNEKVETTFYDISGNNQKVSLEPNELKWITR